MLLNHLRAGVLILSHFVHEAHGFLGPVSPKGGMGKPPLNPGGQDVSGLFMTPLRIPHQHARDTRTLAFGAYRHKTTQSVDKFCLLKGLQSARDIPVQNFKGEELAWPLRLRG